MLKFKGFSLLFRRKLPTFATRSLHMVDPIQQKLLEEVCIVVDEKDRPLGGKTKKECHLMENIRKGLVHRAFSVFLFNSNDELLLQQRAQTKITFPGYYTNTCCSHPLYLEAEMEDDDAKGVKRAARRRLEIELGIPSESVDLDDFHYMTRILYTAPSNGIWGEKEVDYVLILQKDVQLNPNPNEVSDVHYVSRADFPDYIRSLSARGEKTTPWFNMIMDTFLYGWWNNLHSLHSMKDHMTIHCV